jgi:hypothetical protein
MDDEIRVGINILKEEFLRWRKPPVELPPDSVIEQVVRKIIEYTGLSKVGKTPD